MKTEHQLIGALALLAALGGVYFVTQSSEKAEREQRTNVKAAYPQVSLAKDAADKLTKLELKNGDKPAVVLEKKGDAWELTAPVAAKANQNDIKSLLGKLAELKIAESLDRGTGTYDQYEVADGKGVHFSAFEGDAKKLNLVFGKSGSRGQMMRVVGQDGVWIASGYDAGLFGRDGKGWRDKTVLKLEDASAVEIAIENERGSFAFVREGDNWQGTFAANADYKPATTDDAPAEGDEKADDKAEKKDKKKDAKKADKKAEKKDKKKAEDRSKKGSWTRFEGKKVEDLLRSFKSLNAIDFAEASDDTGVDAAAKTGGVITIKLKDGDRKLFVGKPQKGANRFVKTANDDTVFVISSWAADWVTSGPEKFEKPDEKAEGDKPAAGGDMPDLDLGAMGLGGE